MNCYYCDRIVRHDPAYPASPAEFDVASEAPRCARHWRYVCGKCGRPAHFMACAYDPQAGQFFCRDCADETEEVPEAFWHWAYYWRYRSPFTQQSCASLDHLEFEGLHPMQRPAAQAHTRDAISREPHLVRYPPKRVQWRPSDPITDEDVRRSWQANAERWDAKYDDDGDRNRKYQCDEPMMELLGAVAGLAVLDAGSGQGYLSRKLAQAGAQVTGVEQCEAFMDIARQREAQEKRGISYHLASITDMSFLPGASFDKVVSNYVLMDVRDYERAVAEVHRVLKPGGVFVTVISHPCFSSADGRWHTPAPDSPRAEDRAGVLADRYFERGSIYAQWGDFDPVTGFHRPLRDYWQTFVQAGFDVTGFDEPSVTDRGRRELSASRVAHMLRIPYSCIFRLAKRG